jgi:hypothetical protein
MLLMGVFAARAGILAVIGIYGLMAYIVDQRSQVIGVMIAFGAERFRIGMIVAQPQPGRAPAKRAGRWRLETKPEHASAIAACDPYLVARLLTAQAIQTLAIGALRQPVSSSEVDAIRGVNRVLGLAFYWP